MRFCLEMFVGLVPQEAEQPAKVPTNFRWIPGEYLDLPFTRWKPQAEKVQARMQPDAVLEIPGIKQRYFIELETGSDTIWDEEKLTSTLSKLDRYVDFLFGWVGPEGRSTPYLQAFPDKWPFGVG